MSKFAYSNLSRVWCLQNTLKSKQFMFIYVWWHFSKIKTKTWLFLEIFLLKTHFLWCFPNIWWEDITVQCFCEMKCCYIYDIFLLNKDLYILRRREPHATTKNTNKKSFLNWSLMKTMLEKYCFRIFLNALI